MSVAATDVDAAFRAFVTEARFPCLGGTSVVRRHAYRLGVYHALGTLASTAALAGDLAAFAREKPIDDSSSRAFVAVFPYRPPPNELAFEHRLWSQLQRLHHHDDPAARWDPTASADPEDPRFAFSFAGRAFFVVGLHPHSSRLARRFEWPALVFNPHAQFERLRADGHYARFRDLIREREMALQGTLNPNLADFGDRSEARQYSGRATEPEWRCPFHPKPQ